MPSASDAITADSIQSVPAILRAYPKIRGTVRTPATTTGVPIGTQAIDIATRTPRKLDMEVNATFVLVLAGLILGQLLLAALLITRRRITLSGLVKLLACELVCVFGLLATWRLIRRSHSSADSQPVSQRALDRR